MKTAVVYWSGTGNTETMANAVAEGAKKKGAEVTLMTSAEFDASMIDNFDTIAFGCPAMGAEDTWRTSRCALARRAIISGATSSSAM